MSPIDNVKGSVTISLENYEKQSETAAFLCFGIIMAREFAGNFYKTKLWKECRKAYIKSVGGLCERCWAKGIIRHGDTVHHKIRLTPDNINDPSITLNFDNLELLCRDCHAEEHKGAFRYKVDELGHVSCVEE